MEPTFESEEEIFNADYVEIAQEITALLKNADYKMTVKNINEKYGPMLDYPATNKGRTLREYFKLTE